MLLAEGGKQGLQHIVRLSGMGADKHNLFANHHAADSLLLSSDIHYTALQPNTFMQNFYNYSNSIKDHQNIIELVADAKESFIDARDIAQVAAVVLTQAGHENKIYELTGGEALDYDQVAKIFSDILKKEITYKPLSSAEYVAINSAEGMPSEFIEKFVQFSDMVKNGDYARVSPTVQQILGRPPITLSQFVADYRNFFAR